MLNDRNNINIYIYNIYIYIIYIYIYYIYIHMIYIVKNKTKPSLKCKLWGKYLIIQSKAYNTKYYNKTTHIETEA